MHLSEFQESWESDFEKIANFLSPALTGSSARILHVGSTSIPGSIAKPIIDIDVVVKDITEIKAVQEKIESFGYMHHGDLGISGREAFLQPPHLVYHHLYLLQEDSQPYLDHVDFKNALIMNPPLLEKYNALKRSLEHLLLNNREAYTEGKSLFIKEVLFEFRRKTLNLN